MANTPTQNKEIKPVKKNRVSKLMFHSRLQMLERAFVQLGIPVETLAARYGLSVNMMKIYMTKYKWLRKRRAYLDALVYSDNMNEQEQHIKYRQALASEMWERMTYKVEQYMDRLEPTVEDEETGEITANPDFIYAAQAAVKVAKDARLMERLEYGQPSVNSTSTINATEGTTIKGVTVIAPDSYFSKKKEVIEDGTISETPRVPVEDIRVQE